MNGPRRALASLAVMALVAAPLTACGSDGLPGSLPSPTGSITLSPTRTPSLPTPTRTASETPTPSETPSEAPSETPSEAPSEAPSETPSETPTPTPTETVTVTESPSLTPTESPSPTLTQTPTQTPTPTPTASPESDDADETAADDEKQPAPAWVWWLLGLVLLAAAIATPLLVRSRRRSRWRADLAAAEADLAWLARDHLPDLRQKAGSPDRVVGGWEVAGEGRALAVEDHLTALEASAPDDEAAARARALRDAVRTARERLSGLANAPAGVTATLDAAIADLAAVLPPRTTPA